MKKGKKLLALLVGVLMLATLAIGLAACGGGKEGTADVFWYDFADGFLSTVRAELDLRLGNMDVINHDAAGDAAEQKKQIDTVISRGTDILIVNVVNTSDTAGHQLIANAAKTAKIPLVFFNREIAQSVVDSYDDCVFVGTIAPEGGMKQGVMIGTYLLDPDNIVSGSSKFANESDEIMYTILRGEEGNNEAFFRSLYSVLVAQAMLEQAGTSWTLVNSTELADKTEIASTDTGKFTALTEADLTITLDEGTATEFVRVFTEEEAEDVLSHYIYGNWSQAEANRLFGLAVNSTNVDDKDVLGIIIANNDDQALGAIAHLKTLNYNRGGTNASPFIPVFGVDATDNAVKAIRNKEMVGSILQSHVAMATALAQLAYNIAGGLELKAHISVMYQFDEYDDFGVYVSPMIRIPYGIITK